MLAISKGRRFRLVDVFLEPGLAMIAGMTVWAFAEVSGVPDVVQGALTCIGAWGGTHTMAYLEAKYFKRPITDESKPGDLTK